MVSGDRRAGCEVRTRSKTLGKTTHCELLEGPARELVGSSIDKVRGCSDRLLSWRMVDRQVHVVVFRQHGNALAGELVFT